MIPINKPVIDDQEIREILRVLEENTLTDSSFKGGKRLQDFESLLCDFLKVKHVVAVNSGTSALYAALVAAGIRTGDEVLVPSFTFVATANAVLAAGARPIFVDIKDYTISVADLKSKITKKTKAVIPVHLYGHPCDMDEILEVSEGLQVIEDACQSLGATYKKKQTGTFGVMGCFSMYATKVITAGEGGAIATDSDKLADRLRIIRNHGMISGYDMRGFGLNLRLSEIGAAIAKVQMGKLAGLLEIRRQNAAVLSDLLAGSGTLPTESQDKKFNWYLYTVAFAKRRIRERVKEALKNAGIATGVYYDPPVHKTPYYRRMMPGIKLVETERISKLVLSLPVHPGVDEEDLQRIAFTVLEAIK